ncbi:type ISP restriction/modification enzyme [Flavobacterium sp. KACC 22761]|uniref:type ISP restriction/modification enzyme n=1 Tax=Flavobacterium sp. KACC 22761 TaxID=3092665 RepID=UPI002A74C142|nr:type ISP restriction/modification enzyme [Flavobacterium sp. KACC 22761]WPO77231.1 type ISP restriction/modification enzyme [Flavobacterium sp. KACC 22761]
MTVRYYWDKINNWNGEESEIKDFGLTDLENLISKNALNRSENYFTLEALFQKSSEETTLNIETANLISKHIGLLFLNEKETENVCSANNPELRTEFRQSFRILDLLDFIYAILHSSLYENDVENVKQKIPIPHDADLFWKIVQIGNDCRNKEIP